MSETPSPMVDLVRRILEKFAERNVIVNKNKCDLLKDSVVHLGYKLLSKGVQPNTNVEKVISELRTLTNKNEAQKTIGILKYLSNFIPNLAKQMKRTIKLLRKPEEEFKWTDGREKKLKRMVKQLNIHQRYIILILINLLGYLLMQTNMELDFI